MFLVLFCSFQWLYFLSPQKICKPPRFCLARMPLTRIARVVVVVKIFSAPEKYFFLLLFCSLF